jgi:FMN hydrolase / 5-amino-6-(5-phospho-D-ribitylamino)uracil phosphatase
VTAFDPAAIRAVTFDFGNTLVPVGRAGLVAVVEATGRAVIERMGPFAFDEYLRVWAEERERQFREDVPQFRETDLRERFVRVLARLRGMPPPPPDRRWDEEAAAPDPAAGPLLADLAEGRDLAIVSNWPFAATIDRYVLAAGWRPLFRAIVVSQRVGVIKPHSSIFAEARRQLGDPEASAILHVGDDWAADVVGAAGAGWRVAYLAHRPEDSPLPSSEPDGSVTPDLEIGSIAELRPLLTAGARAAPVVGERRAARPAG